MMLNKIILKNLWVFFALLFTNGWAQNKTITGTVTDATTGEALIGVNIVVKHTVQGVSSDLDGNFTLSLKKTSKKDTLEISYIGYQPQQFLLKDAPKHLLVKLNEENQTLNEIVLRPDFSFEEIMMDRIMANKSKNNPELTQNIKLHETVNTSVLLANLDKETKAKNRYKNAQSAFIKDTDSTYMLPIIHTEEKYLTTTTNKKTVKTLLSKEKESALENIDGFINNIVNNKIAEPLNFYNNLVYIFDKSFPSPISSAYKLYYNVYVTDSILADNGIKHYKFEYFPKNDRNPVFKGEFWINGESYALESISAQIPVNANVNFITKYHIAYAYQQTQKENWYLSDVNTFATLSTNKSEYGKQFRIQKRIHFNEHNTPNSVSINAVKPLPYNAISDTLVKSDITSVKAGITTLKHNPFVKTVDRLASMTLTGYYETNTIDIGPYFDFAYRNKIEGQRFNLPLRTGEKLWKNGSIGGYLGYGTKDKKLKYGLNLFYRLSSKKRTEFKFRFKDDYVDLARNPFLEFIQENPFSQGGGNILSILQTSNLNPYLLKQKLYSLDIIREFTPYLQLTVRPKHRILTPNRQNPFTKNGENIAHIKNTAVLMDLRYSKDLAFDQQFFSRTYFGGVKPVYHFISEIGKSKLSNGTEHYYAHFNASIKKIFYLETIKFQTYFDVGGILGKTPYPLYFNPQSIQGFAGGRYVYNLLDNYSFASTLYSNLHVNINGGGILFNKIPLLRKLNLREASSIKMFNGHLKSSDVLDEHPNMVTPLNEPYIEMGIGISNIFKVLRLEYVHRLNTGSNYDAFSKRSAIKMRIEVSF